MPVYEYKCEGCGEEFERMIQNPNKREQPTKNACESCGEKKIVKKLSSGVSRGDSIRMGHKKPDETFRRRLNEIGKAHPLGPMENRYA